MAEKKKVTRADYFKFCFKLDCCKRLGRECNKIEQARCLAGRATAGANPFRMM